MEALRSLFAIFDIKIDDKEVKEAEKSIDHFVGKLKEFGEVLAGGIAGEAVKSFIEGQIKAGAELKVMSERLGVGAEELQQFQLQAQLSGASAEQAAVGLRFLNRNIAQALGGAGDATAAFQALGVSFKGSDGKARSVNDVIEDVATNFEKLDGSAQKTQIAIKLFGRGGAALIPMLNRGKEGAEEAKKAFAELGGGLSDDFIEKAHDAEKASVKMDFALKGLKSQIALAVLPTVERAVTWTSHLIASFKGLISHSYMAETAFIAIGAAIAVALLPAFLELVSFIAPFLILYLVFDDLYTLFKGGKSVIGDLIDSLFGVGSAQQFVKTVTDALNNAFGSISWEKMRGEWHLFGQAIIGVKNILAGFIDSLISVLDLIGNISTPGKSISDSLNQFKNEALAAGKKALFGITGDQAYNVNQSLEERSARLASTNPEAFAGPPLWDSKGSGKIFAPNQTANHKTEINVVVQGNADKTTAHAIGNAVKDATSQHFKNAYAAFAGGDANEASIGDE